MVHHYQSTLDLERALGDPFGSSSQFSFQDVVAWDEAESYPGPLCDMLNSWGLPAFYVPKNSGGRLNSHQELLSLIRSVSRRDLTAAVAHGKSFLGSLPVWIAGTQPQAARLAQIVRTGGQVALGLTEPGHGTDLLAIETEIRQEPLGESLHGCKWLVNNATRSRAMVVLAKAVQLSGPRSLSFLLIDKTNYETAQLQPLPRIRTLGLRGADISGLVFNGLSITQNEYVGNRGTALDTILRVLQVSRTVCAAMSLGVADTALRTALTFATGRHIYNKTVLDLSSVQRGLVNAFADLLACECVVISTGRTIDASPRELNYRSAIAKAFVPETTDVILRYLARIIGARFYLREGLLSGIFQKMLRDHAAVGMFDGSTTVNLELLAFQLHHLLREPDEPEQNREDKLRAVFDLSQPLDPMNYAPLTITKITSDAVLTGLGGITNALDNALCTIDPEVAAVIRCSGSALDHALREMRTDLPTHLELESGRAPVRLLDMAEHYLNLHAAAVCLRFWVWNRSKLGPFFSEGTWLAFVLPRLLSRRLPHRPSDAVRSHCEKSLIKELLRRFNDNCSFSIIPMDFRQEAYA